MDWTEGTRGCVGRRLRELFQDAEEERALDCVLCYTGDWKAVTHVSGPSSNEDTLLLPRTNDMGLWTPRSWLKPSHEVQATVRDRLHTVTV